MTECKETKEGNEVNAIAEKFKCTVATIEGGNHMAGNEMELSKNGVYYETALEATTFGKFNYLLIIISGLILANVLLETLGISFVLPVSQCDLNLSIQQRGMMSAVGFAGIISSSHLWGFLADTKGRRKVIRPTLLLGFVATVLSSFATDFWLLMTLRYINGFCISGGSATIYAYLGEFHTSKNRSRAIMGSAFIFGVGAMMMPALAWLVINADWRLFIPFLNLTYKPWRFFMVVCGIPGFLCGLCLFKIPESPKFLLSQQQEEKTLQILQNIYHINTGQPREQYLILHVIEDLDSSMQTKAKSTVKSNAVMGLLRSMWHQTQPLFNREYMRSTILICLIQFWIFVTSNGMFMWFPHILNSVSEFVKQNPNERAYICNIVYEKQQSIFNPDTAAMQQCNEKLEISTYGQSLILELSYAVGFAFIGFIINKVGKMCILFTCLTFCGACGIVIVFINQPMLSIYLYLVLLLCGLGINVLSAATVDLYPTRLRAMAVCISLMMGRLGSVVGANVVGALISNNCETAFIASGTTLILSAFLAFLIPKAGKTVGASTQQRRTSIVSMTGN